MPQEPVSPPTEDYARMYGDHMSSLPADQIIGQRYDVGVCDDLVQWLMGLEAKHDSRPEAFDLDEEREVLALRSRIVGASQREKDLAGAAWDLIGLLHPFSSVFDMREVAQRARDDWHAES